MIGLVVFFILIVVQYVVVTAGAQRVSEVAARFTLDSMPGQQMSIDADLNLGLIDQKQAIERREGLEKEASFYGAMDGASKFVKGDAIAGIIILLIDIIAGLIVGVAQMGMGWNEALQRFTLLTIGDGIATQLPALIISIATGIIVTRSVRRQGTQHRDIPPARLRAAHSADRAGRAGGADAASRNAQMADRDCRCRGADGMAAHSQIEAGGKRRTGT